MWELLPLHFATISTKLELRAFLLFNLAIIFSVSLPICNNTTPSYKTTYYSCDNNEKCKTYAFLRANSHYPSLSNLSSTFAIPRSDLAEVNAFPSGTDLVFYNEQPLLIPIECACSHGVYEAQVIKNTVKGDSFSGTAESLEGLTTCNALSEKNPSLPPWNLDERINLLVPLECACPSLGDSSRFLLSYPVREGDTLPAVASKFNVSTENIVSANTRHVKDSLQLGDGLVPLSILLIPLQDKPVFESLVKPVLGYPATSIHVRNSRKRRKPKMLMIGVYVAVGIVGLLACVAIGAAFIYTHRKRKREDNNDSIKNGDLELQQLSLSIRTTSDNNKVSFEGSQYNFDDPIDTTTPHKMRIDNYTFEELQKATENFSLSNLIEGSVYHGRLKGKNFVIKHVTSDTISRIDYNIFQERMHRHPNTIRLLGTCLTEGPDSYIVLEYAKNGSLKDWIHGGLAIKSQFIASCNCFLTWNQRVKICLDVATALQYMHHIMNPCYVHRNIKSRNIFLDEDFSAKVGNFGMSKCTTHESDGREGYLPPECFDEATISPSMDIFAYGVVLLEILSGKAPIAVDEEREEGNVVKLSDEIKLVLQSEDAEQLKGWMDSSVGDKYSFDAAVSLANLARSCVEDDPCLRPNAGEIVEKLLRLAEEMPDEEQFNITESSTITKPLVRAAAKET